LHPRSSLAGNLRKASDIATPAITMMRMSYSW
jgi:hypothetical protein